MALCPAEARPVHAFLAGGGVRPSAVHQHQRTAEDGARYQNHLTGERLQRANRVPDSDLFAAALNDPPVAFIVVRGGKRAFKQVEIEIFRAVHCTNPVRNSGNERLLLSQHGATSLIYVKNAFAKPVRGPVANG